MQHEMTMSETFELANMLVKTQGILPQSIRTPGECVAVILTGRELGLPPMASLRLISLLRGKVAIDSACQLGLMQRAGAKIQWLTDSRDPKEALLRITRPGNEPFDSHYTIEMAKNAELLSNNTWKKYPAAMLRARAVSAAGKAYMPDVLAGVYLPGEIEGDDRPEDNVDALAAGEPLHEAGRALLHQEPEAPQGPGAALRTVQPSDAPPIAATPPQVQTIKRSEVDAQVEAMLEAVRAPTLTRGGLCIFKGELKSLRDARALTTAQWKELRQAGIDAAERLDEQAQAEEALRSQEAVAS